MAIKNKGLKLPSRIEKAIRECLDLNEEVIISRNSKLVDLDNSLDSLDLIQILSKIGVNPQDYCHGESLDKKILRYVVEKEKTELTPDDRERLYNDSMCLATTDVIPYVTVGHIARIAGV